jgi:hypothetical protein
MYVLQVTFGMTDLEGVWTISAHIFGLGKFAVCIVRRCGFDLDFWHHEYMPYALTFQRLASIYLDVLTMFPVCRIPLTNSTVDLPLRFAIVDQEDSCDAFS